MYGRIIAIDPGDIESGYVVVAHDGQEITEIIDKGKIKNEDMYDVLYDDAIYYSKNKNKFMATDLAIEMIANYGMPVGKTVFDTCVWVGRFAEYTECAAQDKLAERGEWLPDSNYTKFIYRKDEKMNICGTMKAKDANIRQALIDRYAPNTPNSGKGTAKEPGFFYGFKADIWQAFAVAVTYFDMYVKGETK